MKVGDAALCAAAAGAAAVAVAFTWQPGLASLFDDSVSYLLLAQAASPFGSATPAALAAAAQEKYPPLLGWLVALAGGAFDWRIAHAVVAIAFGVSVLALGWHARAVTGLPALGAAAALVYALMPGAWLNVKGILSEFPYMALSFAAMAVHASRRGTVLAPARAATLGALLAAAFLTRTIGVALIAAILAFEASRYLRERDRRRLVGLAWIIGVPMLAGALWYALRPAAGEDAYVSFGSQVAREASSGGAAFALQLAGANAAALRDAWLTALIVFWGEPWKPGFLLASAIGIAGALAGLVRAARGEADGLYAIAFVGILLAWPFPGQMFRLALPILPLLLVFFLWGWWRILERYSPADASRRAAYAVVLPLAVCLPPTLFYVAPRAASDESSGRLRHGHIAEYYRIPSGGAAAANAAAQIGVFEDLARVGETTPPGARVAWFWPSYVALLAGREGVRLERAGDRASMARQLSESGAHFVYMAELHPRDSAGRDGHPLASLPFALELGRPVWHRASPAGTIQGVLVEIDEAKVRAALKQ
ncbi:MAG TPA: hypothetical protein VEC19_17965 [Usitatibacter sp.]|nr:hypothetical protein [Usitatibacter sp.]